MGALQLLNFIINAGGVPSIAQGADGSKPTTAASGALYCADDTSTIYYWTGTAWAVLVSGADTGAYIRNSGSPQNPGVFNIVGQGQILNGATDPTGTTFSEYLQNVVNFPTLAPATGSLSTADNLLENITFTGSINILNSVTITAMFARLRVQSTSSGTITVNQGASSQKRALAAVVANVYLPSLAPGINSTVTDVAAFVALAPYQDGGTTNSEKITNYYGLLLPPSDEQLSFAAITNKFGINQDGINDQNVFKGPMRLSNTPLLNSNSNYFLQTDASGNVSIQPAYTSAAIATYTGTVSFTATVAPSGATSHSFRWTQTGNLVTLNINLLFAVAGTVVTNVIATLPTGLPNPVIPTGFTGNNTPIQSGTGVTIGSLSSFALQQGSLYLSYNGTNWRINYPTGALATLGVSMTMQYFTS